MNAYLARVLIKRRPYEQTRWVEYDLKTGTAGSAMNLARAQMKKERPKAEILEISVSRKGSQE